MTTATLSARPPAIVPRAAAFTTYDASFARVLGSVPRLVRVVDVDAHEGPVYAPLEDALYVTGVPTDGGAAIRRIALAGERWGLPPERVSTVPAGTTRANGMTAGPDGTLLVCEQGDLTHPARISRVETRTASATVYVEHWNGRPLNSPNDLVLGRDGAVWFTDPSYGHLQGFRPPPAVGDFVYRLDVDGSLRVVEDSFDKPNGIALSPDQQTLYVTDSGANQKPGSFHPDRPHHVMAFDVTASGHLTHRRLLAVIAPGFPDGLKTDAEGRIYVSSAAGVEVLSPEGAPLGRINLPGAVNFTFGGPGNNVLFITADTAVWAAVLDTEGA
jgi:gluconolactonase